MASDTARGSDNGTVVICSPDDVTRGRSSLSTTTVLRSSALLRVRATWA
ncbi:hypothetical protein ACETU7_06890 [Rhodococcus sp. 3Y1]